MPIFEPRMDLHFENASDFYNSIQSQENFLFMKRKIQSNYESDAFIEKNKKERDAIMGQNEKQQKEIELLRKMLVGKLN